MRNITFLIVMLLLFGACANSYQKALKNPDNRAKLEMADTYYKKKDLILKNQNLIDLKIYRKFLNTFHLCNLWNVFRYCFLKHFFF